MLTQSNIEHAVNSANEALYHLTNAENFLNSAGNWGIFDMLGGKLIASAAKHSKMSQANEEILLAKQHIQEVSYFLKDQIDYIAVDLNVDGLLSFADTFLDSFIMDMVVQGRINDAKTQVREAISTMEGVLDALSEIEEEGF
ncbi:MAG: hypothetical protein IKR11_13425 [Solobacterium sp.]|nr:hypothetical protein [Solobacterium sp.]